MATSTGSANTDLVALLGGSGSIESVLAGNGPVFPVVHSSSSFIGDATTGATVTQAPQTVAVNGTLSLGGTASAIIAVTATGHGSALFSLNAGVSASEISDPTNGYSHTKDNANTINVYWDTSAYFVQNKTAGSKSIRVVRLGE